MLGFLFIKLNYRPNGKMQLTTFFKLIMLFCGMTAQTAAQSTNEYDASRVIWATDCNYKDDATFGLPIFTTTGQCFKYCMDNPRCTHYTLVGPWCYLKSGSPGKESHQPGAYCGFIKPMLWPFLNNVSTSYIQLWFHLWWSDIGNNCIQFFSLSFRIKDWY